MKTSKRLLSLLLAVLMVVTILPADIFAAFAVDDDAVVVIACSDFQDPKDTSSTAATTGSQRVKDILSQVEDDHPEADGFICCGDYDKNLPSQGLSARITSLKNAVNSVYENLSNFFLVEGNHDQDGQSKSGLTGPGAHDTDDYGVFIIDEDDYQWSSGVNATRIQQTAANLQEYFDAKDPAIDTEPIFVVSHVPLHYSSRTYCDGDGAYAKYIFDVLQAAGEEGFTVIFLHGHDHSQGFDNYLGGAVDYLPVGHEFYLAVPPTSNTKANRKNYTTETLKFTYMNAGYIGYYADYEPEQANTSGVDDTLTMSVFTIDDGKVTVERYSKDGKYENLKSKGVHSLKHASDESTIKLGLFEDVITCPQTITLREATGGDIGEDPVVPPVAPDDDTVYTGSYEYADSVTEGKEYILVSNGYALQNNNGVASAAKVKVNDDGTVSVDETAAEASILWKFNDSSFADSGDYTVSNNGLYIGRVSGDDEQTMSLLDTNTTYYAAWSYIDGAALRQISGSSSDYLFYAYNRDGAFYVNHDEDIEAGNIDYTLKLYEKKVEVIPQPDDPETGAKNFVDSATGIKVTASAGTKLNVSAKNSSKTYDGIEKYKLFDITVDGFTNNTDTATVSIPLPEGYIAGLTRAYYVSEDGLVDMNATVVDGYVVFSTDHFSTYMVAGKSVNIDDNSWVKVEIPGESTYTYTLDNDGIDAGSRYIIVAPSGTNTALINNNGSYGTMNVTISNDKITTSTNAYDWEFIESITGYDSESVSLSFNTNNTRWLSNATDYYYYVNRSYKHITSASCTRSGNNGNRRYSWNIVYDGGTANPTTQSITLYKPSSYGYILKNGNRYISGGGTSSMTIGTTQTAWTVTDRGNGVYRLNNDGYYIRYYNGFALSNSTNSSYYAYRNLRLYKLTNTSTTTAETYYLGMDSATPYTFPTTQFANQTALENYLKQVITVCKADDQNGTNIQSVDYTLTASGTVNPTTAGNASYTVSYDGHIVGTISVTFVAKTVTSVELNDLEGTVYRGASTSTSTGAKVKVYYNDETSEDVNITLAMLTGTFDKETVGDYNGLTVKYNGENLVGSFTLHVIENPAENDYPDYPDGGSVRVNKTGSGIDFENTGVAKVELSTTGVPVDKGVDVIVMVDTSSSMKYGAQAGTTVASVGSQRIDYLRNSLTAMLNKFTEKNEDGSAPDIRLALADFNGYTQIDATNDRVNDASVSTANTAQVFTGVKTISASAFEQVGGYTDTQISTLVNKVQAKNGTNFDYAFDTIYRLGYAIQQQNKAEGVERELYVIFMSDGCPYQYNYFTGSSSKSLWNSWLVGKNVTITGNDDNVTATIGTDLTDPSSIVNSSSNHKYFYNAGTNNTHRMADAIKGSTDATYEVISTNNSNFPGGTKVTGKDYMYTVNGLGATVYSIGFCIYDDKGIDETTIETTISRTATDSAHFFKVQGTDQDDDVQGNLDNAFTQISHAIRQAATNARFVDTMGDHFDLQMGGTVGSGNTTVTLSDKGIIPAIEVKEYAVYKNSEVGKTVNGVNVTKEIVGERKDSGTLLEKVTFNAAGTAAYSDQIDSSNTNILNNGVVCAETFWYNTNSTAVMIDTDGDHTNDYSLAPETFYWKIGTIGETEFALSYYVYLTGSMEGNGTCEAGTYPTNEDATLHYTNWLGHDASLETESPMLPWEHHIVRYAFYLVDKDGNVLVNRNSGATGNFNQRIAIGDISDPIQLITNANPTIIKTADADLIKALPEGYTFYDENAQYEIQNTSGTDHVDYWDVTGTTTYVTNYDPNNSTAYTNDDANANDNDYEYNNTIVWFAVKFVMTCVPDVVVIDYGLPVNIDVLANDIFGNNGSLYGIGKDMPTEAVNKYTEEIKGSFFGTGVTVPLNYGTAKINGSMVCYTPQNRGDGTTTTYAMQMNEPEVFVYAVKYENSKVPANNGYYYDTVTVIPATIVYYEDTFVTFSSEWEPAGIAKTETQAQDRPGLTTIANIDADNIYGYDGAYTSCATYSNGTAKKVTVSAGNAPTATFTFTGTGFDVISVTSGDTGTTKVQLYKGTKAEGTPTNAVVDTYYGYTYSESGNRVKNVWTYDGSIWHVARNIAETESLEAGEVLVANNILPSNPTVGTKYVTFENEYSWTPTERGALYQIPVIKMYGLAYGTYTVVITPTYSSFFDHKKDGNYDFYFDAVRIYNPAMEDDTAVAAYKKDNEAYPQFIEVRNEILAADTFSEDTSKVAKGAVFIDGFDVDGTISDYRNYGPNNEVYLQSNQAVAFKLNKNDADVNKVQISAKCVNGDTKLTVNGKDIVLTTSTDLYYDITDLVTWTGNESNTIVLTNNGAANSIVSITNVKITYNSEPAAPVKMMMTPAAAEEAVNFVFNSFIMASSSGDQGDVIFDPADDDNIDVVPEIISVKEPNGKIKAGDTVKITVVTSSGVSSVTVNGVNADVEKVNKKTGEKTWVCNIKVENTGDFAVTVIGYAENGTVSDPSESILNVTGKNGKAKN